MDKEEENRARTDILFKALSDARIIYNKSNYPSLKRDDYKTLKKIFVQIEMSVKATIGLEFPNVNIRNIPPKIVFATFLNQEHGIDLKKEELETILKNIN